MTQAANYAKFGQTIVWDKTRTWNYWKLGGLGPEWLNVCQPECDPYQVGDCAPTPTGTDPADPLDPAPWYDPAIPQSAEFAGLWVTNITGFGSTWKRELNERASQDGGLFGRGRRESRTIEVEGLLVAATCCAAAYGLRWLASTLRAPSCTSDQSCEGNTFTVLDCCSAGTFRERWRQLRSVAVLEGPTLETDSEATCGCGCAPVQFVRFTLGAANPSLWLDPEIVIDGQTMISGPVVCELCPPECVDVDCADDPECPEPSPPSLPIIANDCVCLPIVTRKQCAATNMPGAPVASTLTRPAASDTYQAHFMFGFTGQMVNPLTCAPVQVAGVPADGIVIDGTTWDIKQSSQWETWVVSNEYPPLYPNAIYAAGLSISYGPLVPFSSPVYWDFATDPTGALAVADFNTKIAAVLTAQGVPFCTVTTTVIITGIQASFKVIIWGIPDDAPSGPTAILSLPAPGFYGWTFHTEFAIGEQDWQIPMVLTPGTTLTGTSLTVTVRMKLPLGETAYVGAFITTGSGLVLGDAATTPFLTAVGTGALATYSYVLPFSGIDVVTSVPYTILPTDLATLGAYALFAPPIAGADKLVQIDGAEATVNTLSPSPPAATPYVARDAALIVEVTTGAEPIRNMRVDVYPNPTGGDCADVTADICNRCASLAITYVPPFSTLLIDGRDRASLLTCQGASRSGDRQFGAGDGSVWSWPTFDCAPYCVCVVSDAMNTPGDTRITLALAAREL